MLNVAFVAYFVCFVALLVLYIVDTKKIEKLEKEIDSQLGMISNMAVNMQTVRDQMKTLEINSAEPIEKEKPLEEDEQKRIEFQNQLWERGMNEIFNYSVTTGLKVGSYDE